MRNERHLFDLVSVLCLFFVLGRHQQYDIHRHHHNIKGKQCVVTHLKIQSLDVCRLSVWITVGRRDDVGCDDYNDDEMVVNGVTV